jgi:hypothetical protein
MSANKTIKIEMIFVNGGSEYFKEKLQINI